MIDIIRETNARDKGVIFQFDKVKDIPGFIKADMIIAKGPQLYRALVDIADPIKDNEPDINNTTDWEIINNGLRTEFAGSSDDFTTLPTTRFDGSPLIDGDYAYLIKDNYLSGDSQGEPTYKAGIYKWDRLVSSWTYYTDIFRDIQTSQFLKESIVNPQTAKNPTLDEIKSITDNFQFTNFIVYYTGTDSENDRVIRSYWVDRDGNLFELYNADIGGGLLKEPVDDIAELKAISTPVDGEMRQIVNELPKVVHYVFNSSATEGITPDDNTTGKWVRVVGGLRKEPVNSITELKALQAPEDNEIRFVKDESSYYEFVKDSNPPDSFFIGIVEFADDSSGYWLKRQANFRQDLFNSVVGAVKKGLQIVPQETGLKLNCNEGSLIIYNSEQFGYEEFTISASNPIQFKYIDKNGNPIDNNLLEDIDAIHWEKSDGSIEELDKSYRATFQKLYIDKDGNFFMRRGTSRFSSISTAKRDYAFEHIDVFEDLYYIGGIIIRKDADDIKSKDAELVFASKFLEPIKTSNSSEDILLKSPVKNLNKLKSIENPLDGEMRQVLDTLPVISHYTFNRDATSGIAPDDGTVGFWNRTRPAERFIDKLDPEDVGGTWYLAKSSFVNGGSNYVKFIYDENLGTQLNVSNDEGVDGKSAYATKESKLLISDDGINLNRKNFCITMWIKARPNFFGSTDLYVFGNTEPSEDHKTLHVGWRTDRKFTIAFGGDGLNFDLERKHFFSTIMMEWTHVGVVHNDHTKRSVAYVNGEKVGEGYHTSTFQHIFDLILGAKDTARLMGKFSYLRVGVDVDDTMIDEDRMRNIYNSEKEFLIAIK